MKLNLLKKKSDMLRLSKVTIQSKDEFEEMKQQEKIE